MPRNQTRRADVIREGVATGIGQAIGCTPPPVEFYLSRYANEQEAMFRHRKDVAEAKAFSDKVK